MEQQICSVTEQEFVEACRKVDDITTQLEQSRAKLRSALVRGALLEIGTSIPGFVMVGVMELLVSSGSILALNVAPHLYRRFLGSEAALVCELHSTLRHIQEFSRHHLDRALCLSRDTCVSITPLPSGDHLVTIRR